MGIDLTAYKLANVLSYIQVRASLARMALHNSIEYVFVCQDIVSILVIFLQLFLSDAISWNQTGTIFFKRHLL